MSTMDICLIVGEIVLGLCGTFGVVSWVRKNKWVKRYHIEKITDGVFRYAIRAVEVFYSNRSSTSEQKKQAALEIVSAKLKDLGVRLTPAERKNRLEANFTKVSKELHELKDKLKGG